MILHLKSPNLICINQQSDLLMYSSGLFQRHIVSHIKMEGTPPVTSTQLNDSGYPHDGRADKNPYPHDRRAYSLSPIKYTKKQAVFRSASSFAPK